MESKQNSEKVSSELSEKALNKTPPTTGSTGTLEERELDQLVGGTGETSYPNLRQNLNPE